MRKNIDRTLGDESQRCLQLFNSRQNNKEENKWDTSNLKVFAGDKKKFKKRYPS